MALEPVLVIRKSTACCGNEYGTRVSVPPGLLPKLVTWTIDVRVVTGNPGHLRKSESRRLQSVPLPPSHAGALLTSLFSIEEIYPEEAGRPVRLPRRQTGNSPQCLAVTLLADYTLRTRARLPSAAIVALLVESGITPAGPGPPSAGSPAMRCSRAVDAVGTARTGSPTPPPAWRSADTGSSPPPRRPGRGTASGPWSRSPCRRSTARNGGRCAASSGGWGSRRCTTRSDGHLPAVPHPRSTAAGRAAAGQLATGSRPGGLRRRLRQVSPTSPNDMSGQSSPAPPVTRPQTTQAGSATRTVGR